MIEITSYLNELLEHGLSIDDARAQLATLFDAKCEEIKFANSIGDLLDSMFSDSYPRRSSSS